MIGGFCFDLLHIKYIITCKKFSKRKIMKLLAVTLGIMITTLSFAGNGPIVKSHPFPRNIAPSENNDGEGTRVATLKLRSLENVVAGPVALRTCATRGNPDSDNYLMTGLVTTYIDGVKISEKATDGVIQDEHLTVQDDKTAF